LSDHDSLGHTKFGDPFGILNSSAEQEELRLVSDRDGIVNFPKVKSNLEQKLVVKAESELFHVHGEFEGESDNAENRGVFNLLGSLILVCLIEEVESCAEQE